MIATPQIPIEILAVEEARAGNPDALIAYLYGRIERSAARLVNGYRQSYGARLALEDVTQEGMEWAWRRMHRGLQMRNPVSWLVRVAQLRMLRFCSEQHSPIRVPYTSQRELGHRPPRCASLEAPLMGTNGLTLADVLPGCEVYA